MASNQAAKTASEFCFFNHCWWLKLATVNGRGWATGLLAPWFLAIPPQRLWKLQRLGLRAAVLIAGLQQEYLPSAPGQSTHWVEHPCYKAFLETIHFKLAMWLHWQSYVLLYGSYDSGKGCDELQCYSPDSIPPCSTAWKSINVAGDFPSHCFFGLNL